MKKIIEPLKTLFLATRYSFSFCWRNNKKATLGRIIFSSLSTVMVYIMVQIIALLIDSLQSYQAILAQGTQLGLLQNPMIKPIMYMIVALTLSSVFGEAGRFYRGNWLQSLKYANQREINDHKATLDIAKFKSKEYDDLSKRIEELPSSWQTRVYFSEAMFGLLSMMISFFAFGVSLLSYNPMYVVILSVTAIPMIRSEFSIVVKWWNLSQELVPEHKKRRVLERSYYDPNAFLQALMFNQMSTLKMQIKDSMDMLLNSHEKVRRLTFKRTTVARLVAIAGACIVIIYTMFSLSSKGDNIGTLTIIIAAVRSFQGDLSSIIGTIADQWNSAQGIILIEKDFFGLKPLLETKYPVVPNFAITPTIKLKNVSFAYPGTDKMVLDNINFEIKPGDKVAIVGKSGNGKSTIQALLNRQYDPTSGDIYLEDVNLKNIEPGVLSNIVSAMTQEYAVLSRRVCDEIASSRLGEPLDLDNVIQSARFSNFNIVVESDPDGYQTQIGTEFGGREFSGGEKQRLALARVRYRGTPILILDEPDAKLDPESASNVIDQIFALKGVTVIMITHYVSHAERCGHIIVVEKGRVVEQGTHDELMALNQSYTSLYKKDKFRLGSVSEEDF